MSFLQPPVLPFPHFAQIAAKFHELGVPLCVLPLLPRQNLIDLAQLERKRSVIDVLTALGFVCCGRLQIKFTRPIGQNEFVAYIDGIGKLDGKWCLLEWKTSSGRYPVEPDGLLALDPQLVCYSWMTGIPEVAEVVFVRKRLVEIQYLRTRITDDVGLELMKAGLPGNRRFRSMPRYHVAISSHSKDGPDSNEAGYDMMEPQ